ncbi:DNA topoisomerase (ATP-hydrolyzing) subunit A [Gilliamella sp. B2776]|uniref:DNA topoisomerase (ATP-hydrolyzing) subunit A n=1 Tax=unclassified Gilliamella TaxID=2685620 RepID=UPI00226A4A66|nr:MULTISPECIES: DNA topoisomerase (ATP-hydrolyzing) subunit A [unclassified Gilliamella]MCX8650599.1 DNA topoisomerase (ATP-hydrolyzing) subunit A [Gilliamella sp. B2779]MCX8654286.1 DNA topoisomerase (ATP-hydrolyzing) subunit A [Gilliamella sp. B2737]MCX8656831.1 DNA topoisomerase (ATP-hydrolyzing) subunit A [Gilliamella sp. B2894]MCX8665533.1 DNA topoisomerase (ATP-hydrolyzing) subunit A [Gilliamella sp. B2887]MCX8692447.1 DNA topoisomerase (ATP-hydrolyzing) subunit A [Gilliamella sp. B2776
MTELAKEITPVNIEDELKSSYLDYAMSVIVGRALPDVRDGLKPVHRRVLFAMHEAGYDWNKPYRKSARVVGDVIGKYHPHGDSAVYDTIVRMAQPFSLRYMLVDGQGNFGSVDGDSAAAMRYTEIRMQKFAGALLTDLDKETVDFSPNYDGSEMIPDVLPTRIPNLLINGSSGIAVGMATNIPPHNLSEVINGCLAFIEDENISVDGLMEHIHGPDFPTAALINGRKGIENAYRTGRGIIYIRSKATIEVDDHTGRETIIVNEIPYQVNKKKLIEKIAELVKDKKVEGISALRDESDKDGMRIVIEIKRDAVAEVVLNNLFSLTQLQVSFGINMVALHNGQPKLLNLRDMIEAFVLHRREVVTRRTIYELRKARERAHVLEGLAIALANIDPIIELIRAASTPVEAKSKLLSQAWQLGHVAAMLEKAGNDAARPEDLALEFGIRDGYYYLSEAQAQAILDLRLHRLTGLEHEKILDEYKQLLIQISELLHILASPERLMEVIREELEAVRDQFQDARKTEITASSADINIEDLIAQEDVVVTLSHQGYVKYQPLSDYEAQRRGGKGKSATKIKEEDFVEKLLVANTHDTILCFSSRGRLYWMKVYQLPEASRGSRGRPIINLLPLEAGERITAILPVREFDDEHCVFMATAQGTVKKTSLIEFSRPRSGGIIAINLRDDDELIGIDLTSNDPSAVCDDEELNDDNVVEDIESEDEEVTLLSTTEDIMLFSANGKVVRFPANKVRCMGRTAAGVRGIKLDSNDKVVSLIVPRGDGAILTATQNGYGKRTQQELYPTKSRATKGVISIKVSERNGEVVGAVQVDETDQIMLITDAGTLVRTRVSEVSIVGRNTQGVMLIRTADNEKVVGLQRIAETEDEESESDFSQDEERQNSALESEE